MSKLFDFSMLMLKDAFGIRSKHGTLQEHLAAAQSWLKYAHNKCPDGGVSYGYSFKGGWRAAYPETSGYIATTFFQLADQQNDQEYFNRALRICRWLVSIQSRDGSFSNPRYGDEGIVFDTGQDLFGLVKAFEKTGDVAFKDAARRAADWLVSVADEHGLWSRNEHLNTPHVYNTRTAWALLRMNQIEYHAQREQVARANLDWALAEQQDSGFFNNCSFERDLAPYTHTIAYATRGLLESGLLLRDMKYVQAAQRCADAAMAKVKKDGFLSGQISIEGRNMTTYCCLTGNCQFAITWAKLYDRTHDENYKLTAIKALDYVMQHQDIRTANTNVRGAIKGSYPIWGNYAPLTFPNWATKFFIDAMLLRMRWK